MCKYRFTSMISFQVSFLDPAPNCGRFRGSLLSCWRRISLLWLISSNCRFLSSFRFLSASARSCNSCSVSAMCWKMVENNTMNRFIEPDCFQKINIYLDIITLIYLSIISVMEIHNTCIISNVYRLI